jgi:urease accessory protein
MMSSAGSRAIFCSRSERVGRDGALRLGFERRGGRTVLAVCRYTLPLSVLAPVPLDDPAAVVWVLSPTGGLVGGDRLAIDVTVGEGAHACLTTSSATRVYRTAGEPAIQEVRLRLLAGATLEYVPDHAIPFAGSAFRQSILAELGEGARLILLDAFAAGRVGRGERWCFDRLESSVEVRDVRGWLLRERLRLSGVPAWAGLGLAEGAPYFASVAGFEALTEPTAGGRDPAGVATALLGEAAGLTEVSGEPPALEVGGGHLPRGGWLIRCLARDAPALTAALARLWDLARWHMLGLPPLSLRK